MRRQRLASPTRHATAGPSVPPNWRADLISLLYSLLAARTSAGVSLPTWLHLLPASDAFTHTFHRLFAGITATMHEHDVRVEALLVTQHEWTIEKEQGRLDSIKAMYSWMEHETTRRELVERFESQQYQLAREAAIFASVEQQQARIRRVVQEAAAREATREVRPLAQPKHASAPLTPVSPTSTHKDSIASTPNARKESRSPSPLSFASPSSASSPSVSLSSSDSLDLDSNTDEPSLRESRRRTAAASSTRPNARRSQKERGSQKTFSGVGSVAALAAAAGVGTAAAPAPAPAPALAPVPTPKPAPAPMSTPPLATATKTEDAKLQATLARALDASAKQRERAALVQQPRAADPEPRTSPQPTAPRSAPTPTPTPPIIAPASPPPETILPKVASRAESVSPPASVPLPEPISSLPSPSLTPAPVHAHALAPAPTLAPAASSPPPSQSGGPRNKISELRAKLAAGLNPMAQLSGRPPPKGVPSVSEENEEAGDSTRPPGVLEHAKRASRRPTRRPTKKSAATFQPSVVVATLPPVAVVVTTGDNNLDEIAASRTKTLEAAAETPETVTVLRHRKRPPKKKPFATFKPSDVVVPPISVVESSGAAHAAVSVPSQPLSPVSALPDADTSFPEEIFDLDALMTHELLDDAEADLASAHHLVQESPRAAAPGSTLSPLETNDPFGPNSSLGATQFTPRDESPNGVIPSPDAAPPSAAFASSPAAAVRPRKTKLVRKAKSKTVQQSLPPQLTLPVASSSKQRARLAADRHQREQDLAELVSQEKARADPTEVAHRHALLEKMLQETEEHTQEPAVRLQMGLLDELRLRTKEVKLKPSEKLKALLYKQPSDEEDDEEEWFPQRAGTTNALRVDIEESEYEEVTDDEDDEEPVIAASASPPEQVAPVSVEPTPVHHLLDVTSPTSPLTEIVASPDPLSPPMSEAAARQAERLAAYRLRIATYGPPPLVPVVEPERVEDDDHVAWWSRSPALAARRQAMQDFQILYASNPNLVKHGRTGWPHRTMLFLDHELIAWNWKKGAKAKDLKEDKCLRWCDVRSIHAGLVTPIMRKVNANKATLCLSLVTPHRTLDLQASTRVERDIWLEGLLIAWSDARTKQLQWTSRPLNGIDSNPEILTPRPFDQSELPAKGAARSFGTFFGAEQTTTAK